MLANLFLTGMNIVEKIVVLRNQGNRRKFSEVDTGLVTFFRKIRGLAYGFTFSTIVQHHCKKEDSTASFLFSGYITKQKVFYKFFYGICLIILMRMVEC